MPIDHFATPLPAYGNIRSFAPDTHHSSTPPQPSALLLPTLAEHSLFLVISFFHASKLTYSFLPFIIYLLSCFSLLLSRPASFNQYSSYASLTNANKHLRIHHHLRCWFHAGYIKLYFTYLLTRTTKSAHS